MKRKLQDLIDDLHINELEELETMLDQIHPEIKEFTKRQEEPVHLDVFLVNQLKKKQ